MRVFAAAIFVMLASFSGTSAVALESLPEGTDLRARSATDVHVGKEDVKEFLVVYLKPECAECVNWLVDLLEGYKSLIEGSGKAGILIRTIGLKEHAWSSAVFACAGRDNLTVDGAVRLLRSTGKAAQLAQSDPDQSKEILRTAARGFGQEECIDSPDLAKAALKGVLANAMDLISVMKSLQGSEHSLLGVSDWGRKLPAAFLTLDFQTRLGAHHYFLSASDPGQVMNILMVGPKGTQPVILVCTIESELMNARKVTKARIGSVVAFTFYPGKEEVEVLYKKFVAVDGRVYLDKGRMPFTQDGSKYLVKAKPIGRGGKVFDIEIDQKTGKYWHRQTWKIGFGELRNTLRSTGNCKPPK